MNAETIQQHLAQHRPERGRGPPASPRRTSTRGQEQREQERDVVGAGGDVVHAFAHEAGEAREAARAVERELLDARVGGEERGG